MGMFDDLIPQQPPVVSPESAQQVLEAAQTQGGMPMMPGAPEASPDGMSLRDIPIVGGVADAAFQATQAVEQIPDAIRSMSDAAGVVGQGGIVHHVNTKLAAKQGTQPHVIDPATGGYLRENLGPVIAQDDGGQYFFGNGNQLVNPSDHVVLLDPRSGEPAVFRRDPKWDESGAAGVSRIALEGMLTGPPGGVLPSAASAGRSVANVGEAAAAARSADDISIGLPSIPGATKGAERAQNAMRDLEAFEEAGVRAPAVAFHQGPMASVGKQISETPVIGGPVRNSLDDAVFGAKGYADEIAESVGPAATQDRVGADIQTGLTRFHSGDVKDVPPGQLEALGVTPTQTVKPAELMSRKAADQIQKMAPDWEKAGPVAETTRGVPVPAANTMGQTLVTRRTAADLSDDELRAIIRAPAASTSFGARQEALYEKAFRQVPVLMKKDGSRDALLVAAKNTRAALRDIDTNVSNSIAGQKLLSGGLADRVRKATSGNFQLHDLRAMRTEIGRSLSNFGQMEATLDRGQLKALYRSLSQDIEIGLIDVANRAMEATKLPAKNPRYLSIEQARKAGGALRAFRTADRYTRASMRRMDQFIKIVGATTPEQAAERMIRAAREGGAGNMKLFQSARDALRPEEWGQFAALVLRNLGKPTDGAKGLVYEAGFSPSRFVTNWNKMDLRAKNALFGAEHARSIDNLFRVSLRLANVEAVTNSSRSATNALNVTAAVGTLTSIGRLDLATPALIGGAGGALSLMMSRPMYTRWLTGYLRLRANALEAPSGARVTPKMVTHINRLQHMARQNPELLAVSRAVADENGIAETSEVNEVDDNDPGLPVGNTEDNQEF